MKSILQNLILIGALLIGESTHAQVTNLNKVKHSAIETDPLTIAKTYIQNHLEALGLSVKDIAGMSVNDRYTDVKTGITRIYFLQRYNGFPVYNAILNVNIDKDGRVFYSGNRFVQDLDDKVNATVPKLSPVEAVTALANHLGLPTDDLRMKRSEDESQFVFDKSDFANDDITAELCYQPHDGAVRMAWNILIAPQGTSDKWSTRVDAVTGMVIDKHNWTIYCGQDGTASLGEENSCQEHPDFFHSTNTATTMSDPNTGPQYNVWPAPYESPSVTSRTLVTDPSDPVASPYGWHDTNGNPGAEYTITRGNNVHAFQNHDGDFYSSNDEPDGGPNLYFDFPFNPNWEPEHYTDAAVVNLFYWNNYMHDFAYHFGFDEAAGNFQFNNYGKGGQDNDFIRAMAQFGTDLDSVDNAYFTFDLDGENSIMAMFLFQTRKNYLTVNEPSVISGKFRTSLPNDGWGAGTYVTTTPVTGEVVKVEDGIENPYTTDGCEEIINKSELNGKIAFVDRGGCEFGWKALQAQNAGAIGVICSNFSDDDFIMYPAQYGAQIHIPVVMIGVTDARTLSQFMGAGLKVSFVDLGEDGPDDLDSDLDNIIIAHEFSHGISGRLVGGPSSYCLNNAEQMGEGWSDFLALAVTARPGDFGEKQRGIGSYVFKDPTSGKGYRSVPYSTDMNLMPLTYGEIAAISEEHDLGQVWGAMLWDLYWDLVDQYGWSENPFDSTSGNYRAIKLVIEGLKNTPCSPGFVDGRNAILAADESLYQGEDLCIIWKAFARRGLGFSAEQGSPFDAGDQKESFDPPPICTDKMLIQKSVTDFIHAGDDINVTIKVGNYKVETATNVVVTDLLPEGTSYKLNSANLPVEVQASSLSFDVGHLNFNEEKIITFKLTTDPQAWSKRKLLDEVTPVTMANWLTYTIGEEAPNNWLMTDSYPTHSGEFAWNCYEANVRSRQALELNTDVFHFHVDGDHPVLRFYHRFQTKGGISGGVVDVREVGAEHWEGFSDDMLRHGYTNPVEYLTFFTPNLLTFSGNSGSDYQATYVDLSKWIGKDIQIRFRFGTNDNYNDGDGWLIDDIELMEMVSYNSEACVMSDQGDIECAIAPEAGTIVESREVTTSTVDQPDDLPVMIYPNPASDHISIVWSGTDPEDINVSLLSIDGKVLLTESFNASRSRTLNVNTRDVPAGMYLLKLSTEKQQSVAKVIIQ